MKTTKSTAIAVAVVAAGMLGAGLAWSPAFAEGKKPHWGYANDNGPARWAGMSDKFRTCGTGKVQSPVNITSASVSRGATLDLSYKTGGAVIVNNGHTVQVNVPKGNTLTAGGKTFHLKQFHFHTPSENTVDGKHYDMEMHLVHQADDGQLAVVAVMIEKGKRFSAFDLMPTPAEAGEKVDVSVWAVNPADFMPNEHAHVAFPGSLTTPPCSEGVKWFVMLHPMQVKAATIARFHGVLGNNNRPVNPLNGRPVTVAF